MNFTQLPVCLICLTGVWNDSVVAEIETIICVRSQWIMRLIWTAGKVMVLVVIRPVSHSIEWDHKHQLTTNFFASNMEVSKQLEWKSKPKILAAKRYTVLAFIYGWASPPFRLIDSLSSLSTTGLERIFYLRLLSSTNRAWKRQK